MPLGSRKLAATGLGLAAALLLAAGCGGSGETVDDATVTVTEPGANQPVAAATAPGAEPSPAAPAAPAAAAAATPAPAATKAAGFGTLKGRVTFAGNPPPPTVLVPQGDTSKKDPQVCAAQTITSQRLIVDPETKGVRYALVYIPRPTAVSPEAESAAKAANPVFDQRGCVFDPHVMAVMKGTAVTVKSSDPVGHNVHFYLANLSKNESIQPGSAPLTVQPRAAESRPGSVTCDIHPWMKAWWYVANNPYFAVTDEQGNYEIKNVPAGTQKVVVWQEAVLPAFVTASSGDPVEIRADSETNQDFVIQPGQIKPEG
jgi:plastocyanin